MLEIFTVGGGEYIVNTLNAVAAWSGGGGYRSMLQVIMVMGLAYALMTMAWNLDYRALVNWFMQATLMYLVMMVPTVSIKVTDRTNPGLAPAVVANVPLGLGVVSSFTSQIGDYLTRSAETIFVMPQVLNYSTGGIIYGAKLLEGTQELRFDDPVFATNVQEHFKQCVFYDVMIGRKTLASITESSNILDAIGPGAVSLSQVWIDKLTGQQSIITCRDAYSKVSAGWSGYYTEAFPKIAKQFFPGVSSAAATARMDDIGRVGAAALGGATSSQQLVRQAMFVNALIEANGSFGSPEQAATQLAQMRSEAQTRNTYSTIAANAMKWVPLLNIVLTVVFYAMFPVIFPLMLMPTQGIGVARGYLIGFFYLAAWGPLFVVLNMIFMTRWTSSMAAWSGSGLTAANFYGASGINQDIGSIAGYMIMSVPFIAAGMARGAMSIASHSTSFLAPSQRAAEEAAHEQTTGNYSYGSVSLANRTVNTATFDQHSTAASFSHGAGIETNYRRADGSIEKHTADGSTVFNSSGGISQLSMAPTLSSGFTAEARKSAAEYQNMGAQKREQASQSWSAARSESVQLFSSTEQAVRSGHDEGSGLSSSLDQMTQMQQSWSNKLQTDFGLSKEVSDTASRDASIGLNGGMSIQASAAKAFGFGGGNSASMGVNATAGVTGQTGQSASHRMTESEQRKLSAAAEWLDQQSSTESARQARDSFMRETRSSTDSEVKGASQRLDASLSEARTLSREASRYEDAGKRFESALSEAENNGFHWSRNMSQEFVSWWQGEKLANPMLTNSGWDPGMTNLTPAQEAVREGAMRRFEEHHIERLRGEAPPLPEAPAGALTGPASTMREGVTSWGEGNISHLESQAPHVDTSGGGRDRALEGDVGQRLDAGGRAVKGRGAALRGEVDDARRDGKGLRDRVIDSQWGIMPGVNRLRDSVQTSGRDGGVSSVLPAQGVGFRTYGRSTGGGNQVGTGSFVSDLADIGAAWARTGNAPVAFGDISRRGGGDMAGHAGHERGHEVDVRPIRQDGQNKPVSWKSEAYDRDATREFIQTVRQQQPGATVLFNDPILVREGLARAHPGHDNHLHLSFGVVPTLRSRGRQG